MLIPARPANEAQRLAQLHELAILDTGQDPGFDQLVELTQLLFNTPMVLVSLVDQQRQWFKAKVGLDSCETARDISFCGHVVANGEPLVVSDATLDPRFADNPLVSGAPHLRFYAGIPLTLTTSAQQAVTLGTLCILDTQPRTLTGDDIYQLTLLAKQVEQLLRLHQAKNQALEERAQLNAIVDATLDPLFVKGLQGEYLMVNQAYRTVLNAADSPLAQLTPELHFSYDLLAQARACDQRVIDSGKAETLLLSPTAQQRVQLIKSPLRDYRGKIKGVVTVSHDISDLWNTSNQLEKQQQLLSVLHRGLTDYQALMSGNQLWEFLQQALLELTGSDYALIGEVLVDNETPELKIHAISDLPWNPAAKKLMDKLQQQGMKLTNPRNMIGQVFAQGKVVIRNHMTSHSPSPHFPHGHPSLDNYLGVPIIEEGVVIGMYAIANREQDYDDALVAWLEPFTSTCALLIKLYRQLHERQLFTEQLAYARDQAEAASQAKSDFLSSMSHELRTPLNAIMGFAQLLNTNSNTPLNARQQGQVTQIYKSGQHLLALINEVLDLSKVEAGRLTLSLEAITPYSIINEAVAGIMPLAEQQAITLHMDSELIKLPKLIADYTRLKQVLINLISNAIKYNKPEGSVHISGYIEEEKLVISVLDTGAGIEPAYIEQLFQPFNRLGAENTAIEGSGVGLALTKRIVEQMGGSVGVINNPSQGCEFWFKLPLAPATQEVLPSIPSAMSNRVVTASKTLLYVEDNPDNQALVVAMLADDSTISVQCVHSGELAFELACSHPPDLIVIDINLPGMDGFAAARLLARHPLTKTIPKVAVSANMMTDEIKQAEQADFLAYLTKPLDMARLKALIGQLLE